jgi:hypothetical protein
VTPEEIKAARIKYDPEIFVGFERRARDAALLKPLYPDLYSGYSVREADYTSDSSVVKTTVKTIHRFFERGCHCSRRDGSERDCASDHF